MSLPSACPLCKASSNMQSVVTPHVYGNDTKTCRAFFHCESCDVRYQYPPLSPEEESKFYASEFESFMSGRSGSSGGWERVDHHILSNEPTRLRRMEYINPYLSDNDSILEIGCSSGFMLFPLKKQGFNCIGIEPSGIFSEFVNSNGIDVYDSLDDLSQKKSDDLFDLILHFFVLEHISNPLGFLKKQIKLLKPEGKLIFEIPNAADPLYTIYDVPEFEKFYWSIAHPWYFSKSSLEYLLNRLDLPYEISLAQRYDLSNHMIWARDGKPGGMGKFSHIFGEEFEEEYKKTLISSGNCDTLVAIITNN